jgi:N-carbamoylputrescine amidase
MTIAICQLPDGLAPDSPSWARFVRRVERLRPDLIVLNELPFGPWTAREPTFDSNLAEVSIDAHQASLAALCALPSAVISSRPVRHRNRLANEAFLLADGVYQVIHHKQYFPQEPGFFEGAWFSAGRPGFDAIEHNGVRFGVLLCTELMFNEWARHYRRQGAHVIAVPRASGTSLGFWHAAARMAAFVSGCYVVSSNRISPHGMGDPCFGGGGFVYSPTGELLQETSEESPFVAVEIDVDLVRRAQSHYPCCVPELGENSFAASHST